MGFPEGHGKRHEFGRWSDFDDQLLVEVADNGFTQVEGWYPESISEGTKLVRIESMEDIDKLSSDDLPVFNGVKYVG